MRQAARTVPVDHLERRIRSRTASTRKRASQSSAADQRGRSAPGRHRSDRCGARGRGGRHGPDHQRGDREVREDLHRRRSPRSTRGRRPPPTPRRSESGGTTADRDEQLGEHDDLGRAGVEVRSVSSDTVQSGGATPRVVAARTTRCQVTVPPNQSGSSSLLKPGCAVDAAHSKRSSHSGQRAPGVSAGRPRRRRSHASTDSSRPHGATASRPA